MNASGIYRIVVERPNQPPKFYVGQASNFGKRWTAHLQALRYRKHSNRPLQNAFLKYGEETFSFQILVICERRKEILSLYEQSILDTYSPSTIYNVRRQCVDSLLGIPPSLETRAKISAALTGIKRSPEVCKKMSIAGKRRMTDPLVRAALSEITKRQMTPERRVIISEQQKGTKRSAEAIEKTAAAHRGTKKSAEEIVRRRATWKANYKWRPGRRLSAEEISRRQASRAANRQEQGLNVY